MSDRRIFLKSLSSLPLSVVLANPRLAAAVSAGLQEVEAKLVDGMLVAARKRAFLASTMFGLLQFGQRVLRTGVSAYSPSCCLPEAAPWVTACRP
jgi:hypothetical protein